MPKTNLAAMFKLFSIALQPIRADWMDLLTEGKLRDDVRMIWTALELPQAPLDEFCATLDTFVGRDSEEVLHELRQERTRLFIGDKPLVKSSEGLWRRDREGRRAVRMINQYSIEVQEFMRECGVAKKAGTNDCIDYLETECDFCAFLADRPEYLIEMGKEPIDLLDQFMDEHVKKWGPGLCEDVVRETRNPYFRAAYGLMAEYLKEF